MSDKRIPVSGRVRPLMRPSPTVKAVMSKLTPDIHKGRVGQTYGTGDVAPSYATIHSISRSMGDAHRDAENMRAAMPDIDLAEAIVVSAILSPNDFRDATITWKAENLPNLPPALITQLLDIVQNFFDTELPISKMLPDAIAQALFRKGSYPMLVIPESAIDDIINGRDGISMEHLVSRSILTKDKTTVPNIGLLGNGTLASPATTTTRAFSFEQFSMSTPASEINPMVDKFLSVTDNLSVLKLPHLANRMRASAVASKMGSLGMESLHRARKTGLTAKEGMEINEMALKLYRNRNLGYKEVVRIRTTDKNSRMPIGHPLLQILPPEAYIPVHTPGNPKDHIGGFMIIDEMGYPVSLDSSSQYYQEMVNRNSYSRDQVSNILGRSNLMINGGPCNNQMVLSELRAAHINYVEMDLNERLRNSIYGEQVEIARPEVAYSIMLARSFAQQRTMLVWIPAELMTYLAFDYNEMGIGQSILDRNRLSGMIRASIKFANTAAAMKNSTNKRELTFRIDPDDPTPDETFEKQMAEYVRVNSASVPFSSSHPLDVIDQLTMANTSIKIEGAEDIMPDIGVTVDDSAGNRIMVDTDFMEKTDKDFFMGLGVSQAMMDSTADIEFAVQSINDNVLFSKRNVMRQEIVEGHMANFAKTYTLNSGELLMRMIKAIREFAIEDKKQGVEYTRATGSRLKGQESELEINKLARAKIAPKLDASGREVDPDAPDVEPSAPIHQVLTQNEVADPLPTDEMDVIEAFLSNLTMMLPKPDNTKLEDQMAMVDQQEQAVDKFIDIYMTDDMLTSILGEEADQNKDAIKSAFKSMYLRQFIAENNILPALQKMLDPSPEEAENNVHVIEEYSKYISGMSETVKNLFSALKARHSDAEVTDSIGSTDIASDTTDDGGMGGDFGDLDGGDAFSDDLEPEPDDEVEPEPEPEEEEGNEEPETKEEEETPPTPQEPQLD